MSEENLYIKRNDINNIKNNKTKDKYIKLYFVIIMLFVIQIWIMFFNENTKIIRNKINVYNSPSDYSYVVYRYDANNNILGIDSIIGKNINKKP